MPVLRLRLASSGVLLLAAAALGCRSLREDLDPTGGAPRHSASAIASILARPEFAGATVGILASRISDGRVLHSTNPEALLPSASLAKLFSGVGAILALGPDFRFETRLVCRGEVREGVLHGDLVLVGSGDPNLSQRALDPQGLSFADLDHGYADFREGAEALPGDPLAVLSRLADDAAHSGLLGVQGDIVVDDGLFTEDRDEFVGTVSAVCLNDNLADIHVRPGNALGEPAGIEVRPACGAPDIVHRIKTVDAGTPARVSISPLGDGPGFLLEGQVPLGGESLLRVVPIADPARAAAACLLEALRARGIAVAGVARSAKLGPAAYEDARVIALHESRPLSEAVRVIWKVSQNQQASLLPLVVGACLRNRGTRRDGFAEIAEAFRRAGHDPRGFFAESGSGGGRADMASARALHDLLRFLARRAEFPVYFDALSIAGVDGTLRDFQRSGPLQGRVRAKTGTLVYPDLAGSRWVYLSKGLAGYLDPARTGRPEDLVAFAIIFANVSADDRPRAARALQRAQADILRVLADAAEE